MIGRSLTRWLERFEELTMPTFIRHVIKVTYVHADGTPTGDGYRVEGPFLDRNWRKRGSARRWPDDP
jgi:hypothetical protein